jgi:hypothetical protein
MKDQVIIFWTNERGQATQTPPGRIVASTMNTQAVKNLATDNKVFVLTLSEDEETITVERVGKKKKRTRATKAKQ